MKAALSRLAGLVAADIRQVRHEAALARDPSSFYVLNGITLEQGPWVIAAIEQAILNRSYEAPEHDVISSTLRGDDVVLEIGAGMGYITTVAAGIAASVRSFDANPELARVATRTVARNGRNADVQNGVLARSPQSDSITFYVGRISPIQAWFPSRIPTRFRCRCSISARHCPAAAT